MATDLFGKPLGNAPAFELTLQHKRQATLLYHWMSLEYLRGLKDLIDALIKGADVDLDLAKRQGRDALLVSERWGVRDTAANWSTYAFPALEDFRKSTVSDIAARAVEDYGNTGATQCSRMLEEHSSMWMTPDEEERFKAQAEAVFKYAFYIDASAGVGGRRNQLNGNSMVQYWLEFQKLFPSLPRYRVRTDVEAVTGKLPPRTGVYVPQDDPFGTLQFAWTGNGDGVLGVCETLNEVGRRITAAVGADAMWVNGEKMAAYATEAFKRGELTDRGGFDPGDESDPRWVRGVLSKPCRTTRPCKWYYVERIEGEYEDEVARQADSAPQSRGLRCPAGQPCPREGYWVTPASMGSRRRFKAGELMPEVGGDYGDTIWQWDDKQ